MSAERRSGWEPVLEGAPSKRFACSYDGHFAQQLELNRPVIERFLKIASLDGRLLLNGHRSSQLQSAPDINPDGSTANKRGLQWSKKSTLETRENNRLLLVKPDEHGWIVSVSGNVITDRLMQRLDATSRSIAPQFAAKFNACLKNGLKEALLRDKLTFVKDPYLFGRIATSGVILQTFTLAFRDPYFSGPIFMALNMLCLIRANVVGRDSGDKTPEKNRGFGIDPFDLFLNKIVNYHRRTVEHPLERLSLPVEIDRLLLGYLYLDAQRIKRNPLVRLSPSPTAQNP
ncbi:MAG: hypothetical protein HYY87_02335 [Candidatus Levybacteria bacterium]|nr:hypothetical protein [Candidatus Levybacteria bacterium]MBI2190086.1 hypothetical protein [Candidatus Levybacteria bacterium]MBI2622557.1 hypothetical protein [Candidatus Levybacteria bacterium]MBI3070119.1 hypothetical protein [Candidatus Levybacteria bacterium]MBI3092720.1 hypothetical protein [Candidatus Levybacteria bacterium]